MRPQGRTIQAAGIVVAFVTNENASYKGTMVEIGMALAWKKPLVIMTKRSRPYFDLASERITRIVFFQIKK